MTPRAESVLKVLVKDKMRWISTLYINYYLPSDEKLEEPEVRAALVELEGRGYVSRQLVVLLRSRANGGDYQVAKWRASYTGWLELCDVANSQG